MSVAGPASGALGAYAAPPTSGSAWGPCDGGEVVEHRDHRRDVDQFGQEGERAELEEAARAPGESRRATATSGRWRRFVRSPRTSPSRPSPIHLISSGCPFTVKSAATSPLPRRTSAVRGSTASTVSSARIPADVWFGETITITSAPTIHQRHADV